MIAILKEKKTGPWCTAGIDRPLFSATTFCSKSDHSRKNGAGSKELFCSEWLFSMSVRNRLTNTELHIMQLASGPVFSVRKERLELGWKHSPLGTQAAKAEVEGNYQNAQSRLPGNARKYQWIIHVVPGHPIWDFYFECLQAAEHERPNSSHFGAHLNLSCFYICRVVSGKILDLWAVRKNTTAVYVQTNCKLCWEEILPWHAFVSVKTLRVLILLFLPCIYTPGFGHATLLENNHTSWLQWQLKLALF